MNKIYILTLICLTTLVFSTNAQTVITLPPCTNCPTASSSGASGGYCPHLTTGIDVVSATQGATHWAILAGDSSLWVVSQPGAKYVGHDIIGDVNINGDYNNSVAMSPAPVETYFTIPTRIYGPNFDAIKFSELLFTGDGPSGYIVGRTASGDTWVYTLTQAGTNGNGLYNGDGLTAFFGAFPNVTYGWYRLISGTNANIVQVDGNNAANGTGANDLVRFFLDENGDLWVGGTSCVSGTGAAWAGLGGAACDGSGSANSTWSQLTIPGSDPIVDMAATGANSSLTHFTVLVGSTGNLYWFGNTTMGYPGTPTALAMPAGVTAVSISASRDIVWIKGNDGKLYYTGQEPFAYDVTNMTGANNIGTVLEVPDWTALGKNVDKIFTNDGMTDIYVYSGDGMLYYANRDGGWRF